MQGELVYIYILYVELLVSSTSIHLPPTLRNESKLIQIDKHEVDFQEEPAGFVPLAHLWPIFGSLWQVPGVRLRGFTDSPYGEVWMLQPAQTQGTSGLLSLLYWKCLQVCSLQMFTDVYSYSAASPKFPNPPVKPQAAPPMAQRPVRSFTSDAPETQVALHRVEGMMACSGGCVP